MTGLVEFGLYLTYILVGVAVLAVIVLPLINAFSNPKTLVTSGIGLAALLVIFLISWGLSSYDAVSAKAAEQGLTSGGVQRLGGVLTMMYLLLAAAIVGIVVTEVGKIFK
ncbi:hypothetical protein QQ020_09370 [Fulvivirgaceae bacterium BMA12]|uniref:Uncharacterized protein n=1 Tax=Agaribacillus aureus TaxID=3051825 RepID=A0ABT8L3D6_9BACT|nr:hypothetical protein [Fulvivirgaceae bacterium BMA12]